MRRSALPLVGILGLALAFAACSSGSASPTPAPTLNLGSPAATAAASAPSGASSAAPSATPGASATPAPTAAPTPTATPVPTPTPTPQPTAALRLDPEAAFGALLTADQLPADSEAGDVSLAEEYEFEAFNANHGIRVVSQTWAGESVGSVFHFVFQFPTEADAEAFLRDGGATLSEVEIGLEAGDAGFLFESILDEVQHYEGEVNAFGLTTRNYNYLMRLRNFVAKVFVGGADVETSVAEEIAFSAAQDLNTVKLPPDPNATPAPTVAPTAAPSVGATAPAGDFPNADEAALLEHIPTDTRGTCEAADPFYEQEIDSLRCRPEDGLLVDYSAFESVDDLRAAFDSDYEAADPTPTEDGSCQEGDLLSTYTIDEGDIAGQVMCTTVTSSSGGRVFKVIEWTNEPLRILGYMQSATLEWDDLIEFWSTKAGPIE